MNESANFVFSKLDGYATLCEIADAMMEEFDVDAAMALEATLWASTRFAGLDFPVGCQSSSLAAAPAQRRRELPPLFRPVR
jgi:hypothetical protein